MPISRETAQAAGRIGGLTRAALCPDNNAHTLPARQARFQKYTDKVRAAVPGLTDENEINRRARMLLAADMMALSRRAATARTRAAQARREAAEAEAELLAASAASADAGSDA